MWTDEVSEQFSNWDAVDDRERLKSMSVLRDLRISLKFGYAFGVVCLLCLLLSALTFSTFRGIPIKNRDVSGKSLPAIVRLAALNRGVRDIRREDQNLVLCRGVECIETHKSRRLKAIEHYKSDLKKVEKYITAPVQRDLLAKINSRSSQLQEIRNTSQALRDAGRVSEAGDLLMQNSTFVVFDATKNGILDLFQANVEIATKDAEEAISDSERAAWVNLGVSLFIVMLCGLVGVGA